MLVGDYDDKNADCDERWLVWRGGISSSISEISTQIGIIPQNENMGSNSLKEHLGTNSLKEHMGTNSLKEHMRTNPLNEHMGSNSLNEHMGTNSLNEYIEYSLTKLISITITPILPFAPRTEVPEIDLV